VLLSSHQRGCRRRPRRLLSSSWERDAGKLPSYTPPQELFSRPQPPDLTLKSTNYHHNTQVRVLTKTYKHSSVPHSTWLGCGFFDLATDRQQLSFQIHNDILKVFFAVCPRLPFLELNGILANKVFHLTEYHSL